MYNIKSCRIKRRLIVILKYKTRLTEYGQYKIHDVITILGLTVDATLLWNQNMIWVPGIWKQKVL